MNTIGRIALGTASLIGVSAAPAPVPGQSQAAENPLDRIVCQKQQVLGSRLTTKRVCKSRAEWARDQLDDRQMTDKAQVQRGIGSKN